MTGARAGGGCTTAAAAAAEQPRIGSCCEQQDRVFGTRLTCRCEALRRQTIKIGRAFRDRRAEAQMHTPSALARNRQQTWTFTMRKQNLPGGNRSCWTKNVKKKKTLTVPAVEKVFPYRGPKTERHRHSHHFSSDLQLPV